MRIDKALHQCPQQWEAMAGGCHVSTVVCQHREATGLGVKWTFTLTNQTTLQVMTMTMKVLGCDNLS